jgi:hypothetical protein
MEAILLVAEDARTGLSARLVQGQKQQYIEFKSSGAAQSQILDLPSGFENADHSRQWLFVLGNKVYLLCDRKDQILSAASDGGAWQVKTINLTHDLPALAGPRFKRQIFLSQDGIYCACYGGEWGQGVIYFNFDRQVWQKVFDLKTDSRMVVKGRPNGSLWIISDEEIRRYSHGEVISTIKISLLAKGIAGAFKPSSYYLDENDDLYLSSDSGAVFELAHGSLVPILTLSQLNELKEAKQVRNDLQSTIRYVGKDIILYVLQDGRTILFDRAKRKLLELTLSDGTMTL